MFPELLRNGLWHTTNNERFEGILTSAGILPEPPIPDSQRWGTAGGPGLYPFVRSIGGVSLFDFLGFEESVYSARYPNSMWKIFVPCFSSWEEAIWIEIDRAAIVDKFIDGSALVALWKKQNELGRKIMPVIEAAHIGPVPVSAFRKVYAFNKSVQEFRQILA